MANLTKTNKTKKYWGKEENEALKSYLTDASLSVDEKNALFTKKLYVPLETMINGIIFKRNLQHVIDNEEEAFTNNLSNIKSEVFYYLFTTFNKENFTIDFNNNVFGYLSIMVRNFLFTFINEQTEELNSKYDFDSWLITEQNDIEDDFKLSEHFDYQTIINKTIEIIEKNEKEQLLQQRVNKTIVKILKNKDLTKQIIDAENPELEFITIVSKLTKIKLENVLPRIENFKNKYNIVLNLLENNIC